MNRRSVAATMALWLGLFSLAAVGCGGGGDSGATLSIALTDAKPALPEGVEAVLVTIDEVSVHGSGGEWISLPLAKVPYTLDLLLFHSGATTSLVPPTTLDPGTYTQLRLGVSSAVLRVNGVDVPLTVPSEKVRTDHNFELIEGGAVALTVDFDLSQSIVAPGNEQYHLKPVFHLVETAMAASMTGQLADSTFGGADEAQVVVIRDSDGTGDLSSDDEEYTRLAVPKADPGPTPFQVLWLVPGEGYFVQVEVGGSVAYEVFVAPEDLPPGTNFSLNGGDPI